MCGMLGIGQLGVVYDAGPKISTVHEKWELLSHKVQSAFADQVQFSWLCKHLVGCTFCLSSCIMYLVVLCFRML
jgi:aerobic-type carbon monoxide dehydrogenase small subunit (CoxS/CutS family)